MNNIQVLSKNTRAPILFFVIAVLFSYPQAVYASCAEPGDPEAELKSSDAVFTGTVVYISEANGIWIDSVTRVYTAFGFDPADFYQDLSYGRRIVFEVDRSWKGATTSSITIRTGYNDMGSSSYPFELGEYYLVYASHAYGDPEKYLLTSRCHPTKAAPNNSEDIAYLNNQPTLELSYFPAIFRTIDGSHVATVLFLSGLIYIFRRKRK
jgi:hypothetical protein